MSVKNHINFNINNKYMVEGYSSVSIPKILLKKVDELLKSEKSTYKSRSDFIKDAIRIRLRELGFSI